MKLFLSLLYFFVTKEIKKKMTINTRSIPKITIVITIYYSNTQTKNAKTNSSKVEIIK